MIDVSRGDVAVALISNASSFDGRAVTEQMDRHATWNCFTQSTRVNSHVSMCSADRKFLYFNFLKKANAFELMRIIFVSLHRFFSFVESDRYRPPCTAYKRMQCTFILFGLIASVP